jgi:hypothetical protein
MSAFLTSGAHPVRRLFLGSYIQDGRIRDSVVSITTGYLLDDCRVEVRVPVGSRILFSTLSRPAVGSTQPPIEWVPRVKRPGHEADHSPSASAEVKKMWIYTSTPHKPYGVVFS